MLEQAAIAIDRARLTRENARTAALEESERLNTALFASLSHDLKTPLATISGATTSLRELGDKMDPATRRDLLVSIEEEAVAPWPLRRQPLRHDADRSGHAEAAARPARASARS